MNERTLIFIMQLTRRLFLQLCAVIITLPLIPSLFAAEWSFGVIPDTQWAYERNAPFHGVAIHIIDAINTEFVRQKVDFVIQVGDLAETPTAAGFQTRAARNQSLTDAGIKFYPIRGNHDVVKYGLGSLGIERKIPQGSIAQFKAAFPDLPGTLTGGGSSPDLPGIAGLTYSFTHKGGKFVLLDTLPLIDDDPRGGKPYSITDYLPWIDTELKKDDHHFALVFAHKNIQGQNHKDNIFGRHHEEEPDMQNTFLDCLQRNGVRYFISGHDHLYHRSRIKSPDGQSEVGQVIGGGAAHKFYQPTSPLPTRDTPIAQELNRVGFLIARVDDQRIRFEYYSTAPFGGEPQTPEWKIRDSFGYTWDGQEFGVPTESMQQFFQPEPVRR